MSRGETGHEDGTRSASPRLASARGAGQEARRGVGADGAEGSASDRAEENVAKGPPAAAPVELDAAHLYINRELSWIEFNRRVFALALDESIPILERLKFLCISSTNLDEFFEVRVARLMRQVEQKDPMCGPDQMAAPEQLERVLAATHELVGEQYRALNEVLIPALAKESIRFVRRGAWDAAQRAWIAAYFEREVLPILSPIGLDPAHPFPRVLNKSLNFIVSLHGEDAFGRASGMAVVQAPRVLPRLIRMPPEVSGGPDDFVFLSSIIHAHVSELFPGMAVRGCYQFRVTRDAELMVDEDEVDDLMLALEGELYGRNYGSAVRLEVADNCPMATARSLLDHFELGEAHLYQVNGPVNVHRLMMIPGAVERPDLKYAPFVPRPIAPPGERGRLDLFEQVGGGRDLLFHHPFDSFDAIVEWFEQAASDPDVLAIKQTMYRTDEDSALVDALCEAARAGKEVTAVIELRARFDERRNIEIAARLQESGAHVVYGIVGFKTHAKMALVVRREGGVLRRYAHLGTGNYHAQTARLYTDFGLLTAEPRLCADVHRLFQQLTGFGQAAELEVALQAPFTLKARTIEMIEREAEHARAGRPARIMAKMNSLTETGVIRALYAASQAGVEIDLIVRGVCRLRPGVPGVSERIRVRSIVGRFLEHTRAYYFLDDGAEHVFCSSADWMTRNLVRRVEAAFPILDPDLKARVIEEAFGVYLRDNTRAWELEPDASYRHTAPAEGEAAFGAQRALLEAVALRTA